MGWYQRAILEPMLDFVLDKPGIARERATLLEAASGRILEIGPGSGLNIASYPSGVESWTAIGPDPASDPRAIARAEKRGVKVEYVAGDARAMPFVDASFDTVVSTFVFCSVPETERAVRECHRVLKPGGRLLFLEHVHAPMPLRRRVQRALDGIHQKIAGGCSLTRDTESLLLGSGFELRDLLRHELRELSPLHRYVIRGTAVR